MIKLTAIQELNDLLCVNEVNPSFFEKSTLEQKIHSLVQKILLTGPQTEEPLVPALIKLAKIDPFSAQKLLNFVLPVQDKDAINKKIAIQYASMGRACLARQIAELIVGPDIRNAAKKKIEKRNGKDSSSDMLTHLKGPGEKPEENRVPASKTGEKESLTVREIDDKIGEQVLRLIQNITDSASDDWEGVVDHFSSSILCVENLEQRDVLTLKFIQSMPWDDSRFEQLVHFADKIISFEKRTEAHTYFFMQKNFSNLYKAKETSPHDFYIQVNKFNTAQFPHLEKIASLLLANASYEYYMKHIQKLFCEDEEIKSSFLAEIYAALKIYHLLDQNPFKDIIKTIEQYDPEEKDNSSLLAAFKDFTIDQNFLDALIKETISSGNIQLLRTLNELMHVSEIKKSINDENFLFALEQNYLMEAYFNEGPIHSSNSSNIRDEFFSIISEFEV